MGKGVLAPAVLKHSGVLLGTLAFQLAEQGGGLCGLEAAVLGTPAWSCFGQFTDAEGRARATEIQ